MLFRSGQADEPAREDEWPDVRKRTLLPDWHNWTEQVERRYDGLLAEVRMIVDGLHDEIGDIDKRLRAIVDCVTDWMPRSDQRLDEVEKQVEDLTARADLGKMTDAAQGAALANHSGRLDALEATVKRHEIHITEQARLIAELRRQMRAQSAIIEEVCEDHGPRLDALEARLLNAEKMVFTGNTAEKHQLAYGTD